MSRDGDNYVFSALSEGFITGLIAAVLIPVGLVAGQLLIVLLLLLFGASEVSNPANFFGLLIVSFWYGLMSGFGAGGAIAMFWYLTKVMHDEITRLEFFLIVVTWQVLNYFGATIVLGTLGRTWMISALAVVIVFLALWISQRIRLRSEVSTLEQMQVEGEEFRRELAERRQRKNVRLRRH